MNIIIKPSHLPDKKYDAVIDGRKTIPFGAKNYSDFTIHKDEARKERYISRHKATENWNNYETAGFWSRWLLWEKLTLTEAARNINHKFKNIHVKLQV